MSRYIDAEKIQYNYLPITALGCKLFVSMDEIFKIPTADVQEVKHSHWNILAETFDNEIYKNHYECDNCKETIVFECENPKEYCYYCPNCGAKMDGEIK